MFTVTKDMITLVYTATTVVLLWAKVTGPEYIKVMSLNIKIMTRQNSLIGKAYDSYL